MTTRSIQEAGLGMGILPKSREGGCRAQCKLLEQWVRMRVEVPGEIARGNSVLSVPSGV